MSAGDPVYDFDIAVKAFEVMTRAEKVRVIEIMTTLRFAHATDRFFEAIHRVIQQGDRR